MADEIGTFRIDVEIDLVLLGARTLEGLNVRVDPVIGTLVDAGSAPAAALV